MLALCRLSQHDSIGIDHHAVAPSVVVGGQVARGATKRDIDLVVHRARARLQLPVERARREVEGARVDEQRGAVPGGDGGHFREADVVADCDGDAGGAVGEVDKRDFVAGRERVGFTEGDAVRDVDVEQVHFAMGGEQGAGGREGQRGVVERAGVVRIAFRDGAADYGGACGKSERGEEMIRW